MTTPSWRSHTTEDIRAYRAMRCIEEFKPRSPLSDCWYCGEPADWGSLGDELVLHYSCNGGRGVDPESEHGRSLARLYRARDALAQARALGKEET